jgi:NADH:ubiquinone oxidoreductase subunit 2 (subunit N)
MLGAIAAGFAVVLMIVMVMARTNIRRWLGYSNIVDVTFTVIMIWLLHGTYSGVVAAACAGVIMSLMLTVLRKCMGMERLKARRTPVRNGCVRLYWRRYAASECGWMNIKKQVTA